MPLFSNGAQLGVCFGCPSGRCTHTREAKLCFQYQRALNRVSFSAFALNNIQQTCQVIQKMFFHLITDIYSDFQRNSQRKTYKT